MNYFILLLISGYLLGSIPFGYIIPKIKGINIKNIGSGGTGATNVSRALNKKWAVLVAILDILKAAIPVYLAVTYLNIDWQIALVALSPVIGHNFPVWLNFKGGKGIATSVPAIIVFAGILPFSIALIIWVILLKTTKLMSLNNLIIWFFIPFMFWFHTHSLVYFLLGFIFFVSALWSHQGNLSRLYNNKELKL